MSFGLGFSLIQFCAIILIVAKNGTFLFFRSSGSVNSYTFSCCLLSKLSYQCLKPDGLALILLDYVRLVFCVVNL